MNGPQHYRAAEKLLEQMTYDDGSIATDNAEDVATTLAAAQVHATLAQAAATALQTTVDFYELEFDAEAWHEATGVRFETGSGVSS